MARGRKPTSKGRRWNGTGCINKLSGNRRNPYRVLITTGYKTDEITLKRTQLQETLGYYPTREDAEEALARYLENPYDVKIDTLTFEDVYKQWSKRYFDTITPSAIRTVVSAYNYCEPMHKMIFKNITITIMKDTINNANVGLSTKGRMKSICNLMYDYACESDIIKVNVARNFTVKNIAKEREKASKKKKIYSIEEEQLLWSNIEYGFTRMVLIGLYTGWRPQELAILKREDIDLKEMTMIGGMKTDAGENRIVPIHPKILDLVKYYYSQSEGKEFLFNDYEGQQGTAMTYDKYRGRFNKVMKYNKLADFTPHCARHTFITKAKENNVDEYAIKMIVGHEISDLTEKVYTHRDKITFIKNEILKIK